MTSDTKKSKKVKVLPNRLFVAISRHSVVVMIFGVFIGVGFLTLAHYHVEGRLSEQLFDKGGTSYPYSVQNIMWLVFFASMAEILVRFSSAMIEEHQLRLETLPEDRTSMLHSDDLGVVYAKVNENPLADTCFLPRLIRRCILQFENTKSIEHASATAVSNTEIYLHEIDLKYNLVRYLMWLIPSLGFIGTVIGISLALAYAGEPGRVEEPQLLTEVTSRLAVAFNTTLLALLMSAILVYLAGVVQTREERALNRASQYCLDNLINRLFKE